MSDPIRLLVIEDNPEYADLIRLTLRRTRQPYDSAVAGRLSEALAKLGAQAFDAIVTDLGLPDSQGVATIQSLVAACPEAPVVVLTGVDDDELGIAAVLAGAQDYLVKDALLSASLDRSIRYAIQRCGARDAERRRVALQRAVDAMDQVLGVVGHELRTPVAAIRAAAEMLLEPRCPAVDVPHLTALIHEQSLHMTELLDNTLEAARLRSGMARWNWAQVDLDRVVRSVLSAMTPLVDPARVTLSGSADSVAMTMRGDEAAIRRLVLNLVRNAVNHTAHGRVEVIIRAAFEPNGLWAVIDVADTGSGIDERTAENLGKAFALNRGVVDADHVTGAGLGLAICRGIAAVHGGRITFTTRVGEGTTFSARLRADLEGPIQSEQAPDCKIEAA